MAASRCGWIAHVQGIPSWRFIHARMEMRDSAIEPYAVSDSGPVFLLCFSLETFGNFCMPACVLLLPQLRHQGRA